jgi:SAM-dependent methyltransferase
MTTPETPQQFWNAHYGREDQIWSGNPNAALVRETAGLAPGTALDLGSGEGADAVWLASRGWRVTAVDVSDTAIERARGHADAAAVAGRIEWQQVDLGVGFPAGEFDLVSAFFLHVPALASILESAVAATAPGGTLLVVGHAPDGIHHHHPVELMTADELLVLLGLGDDWTVERAAQVEQSPGGRVDAVVRARRVPRVE